jgi:hypothetical protein
MKATARLYNCARCRRQVILCSYCDNGNIYCFDSCAAQTRRESTQQANKRYRQSQKGRMKAAHRQARFRQRKRDQVAQQAALEQKVTHQGSPEESSSAPIVTGLENKHFEQQTPITVVSLPVRTSSANKIYCDCCGRAVQLHLRRGYLRNRRCQKL